MIRRTRYVASAIASAFVSILVILSLSSAIAITFEIPHDDEIFQVEAMQQEATGQAVAGFETALEQLQAEITMLLTLVDEQRAFRDAVLSQRFRNNPYYNDVQLYSSDARYRRCVRDLIDDQYDLLRDAAKSGVDVTDEDLAGFRDQEHDCRRYSRAYSPSSYSYSPSYSSLPPMCRYFDPSTSDWSDYVEWKRVCERRYYDGYNYYDYGSSDGYRAAYSDPAGYYGAYPAIGGDYHYGDDYRHPYYYDTSYYYGAGGYSGYSPLYAAAVYDDDFDHSTSFTFDSPSYYLDADIPGVTRPARIPSYGPEAYQEWRKNCERSIGIDGTLSGWCADRAEYWA
ncbi:hypothetical protein HYU19_00725 [Candidatus Woesearchaeota archaeon]|nr:hypothetical protein [Candidatus Woesearchaeota archaeon]